MKDHKPVNMKLLPFSALVLIPCLLAAQDRFVQIDGYKVHVNTMGIDQRVDGQPVIVLESGAGTPIGHWDKVLPGIAELAPVVAYERPGIGESEHDDLIPTLKNVSDKLLKVLDEVEVEPPYVLVGHSLGGVFVRGFAVYYPEKLAGLVIIDPGDFTETQENKRDYYRDLGWDEERIDKMVQQVTDNLRKRRADAPPAIIEEGELLEDLRDEDFREIAESPLPNIPVHIVVGGRFGMPEHMRSKEYDDEAVFRSKTRHRVARWTDVIQSVDKGMLLYSGDAGHFVHWEDPELVVASIRLVLLDYEKMRQ